MPPEFRAGPRPNGCAPPSRETTGQPGNPDSYAGRGGQDAPGMDPRSVMPVPDGMTEGLLLRPIGPGRLRDRPSVPPPGRPLRPAGRLTRVARGPPEARGEHPVRVAVDIQVVAEGTTAEEGTMAEEGTAAADDGPARHLPALASCVRNPGPTPSSPRSGGQSAWPGPPRPPPPCPGPE